MRKLNYEVASADGTIFNTADFMKATSGNNKIIRTFLTDIDLRSDKEKKAMKERAEKFQQKLKEKRG